jgi:hypothetical protein
MDAIIISIKGDLKPIALRHHVFDLGNILGIRGFLNYRLGMYELFIHAEGENNIISEFSSQIKQLAKKHRLVCSIETAIPDNFIGFKITPLDTNTGHNFEEFNNSSNDNDIEIPQIKALRTEQQHRLIYKKKQTTGFRKLSSFLKQAGLW